MNLTIKKFQKTNAKRSPLMYSICGKWGLSDWSNKLTEELGEVAKEVSQVRIGKVKQSDNEFRERIGRELADVVTTATLMCNYLELDLEEFLVTKFNEKSTKENVDVFL